MLARGYMRFYNDFTTISALESLRLRLHDPNIANRCKIAYNPSLVVVYFYNTLLYSHYIYQNQDFMLRLKLFLRPIKTTLRHFFRRFSYIFPYNLKV